MFSMAWYNVFIPTIEEKPRAQTYGRQAAGQVLGSAISTTDGLKDGNALQFAQALEKAEAAGRDDPKTVAALYEVFKEREETLDHIMDVLINGPD